MAGTEYYVRLCSRRGFPSPAALISPRLAPSLRRPHDSKTPRSRLQQEEELHEEEEEGVSDRDYVEQVFEGSLVHYYPEEKRITDVEKRIEFTGVIPKFLGFQDLVSLEVWRAAISEFLATALLIFVSSAGAITCLQAGFAPAANMATLSLLQFFTLSFFILAAAPASGGHLNPAISVATMMTGFSSPARTLLYVLAQTGGSVLGSLALKVVVAEHLAQRYGLGGCRLRNTIWIDGELVGVGIATGPGLLAEFVLTLTLLFVAFSVALDPKQFQVTGPILAPFMIGAMISLLVFVSGGLMNVPGGYTGVGLNPVRCFGPAVAMGGALWVDHWVWWVGPALAALTIGTIYHLIPPHHIELNRSQADIFTQIKSLIKSWFSPASAQN